MQFDAEEAPPPPVAPERELVVLHEDDDVLVVDKPPGIAVEPERWARDAPTVSGAVREYALGRFPAPAAGPAPDAYRPRILHRLDKDTSGVLAAAKHLAAERRLRAAFEEGRVKKLYHALVEGEYPVGAGEWDEIDLPLGPDAKKSGRQVVPRTGGRPSRTRVSALERYRGYSLVACEPLTGRTHQIRVHLASRGFPLVVDPLYGRRDELLLSALKPGYRPKRGRRERPLIDRLTLHAAELVLPRADGSELRISSPHPKDFARTIKQLAKVRSRDS